MNLKRRQEAAQLWHTLGHAIENTYQLPHGHAVTIGMVIAAYISRDIFNFNGAERIVSLIKNTA